jgi:hypothetical protein
VDEHGQSTLTCLGELHLELCIKALQERFARLTINPYIAALPLISLSLSLLPYSPLFSPILPYSPLFSSVSGRCELRVSPPLVPFRETILPPSALESTPALPPPWKDTPGLSHVTTPGSYRMVMASRRLAMTIHTNALPSAAAMLLDPDHGPHARLIAKEIERRIVVSTPISPPDSDESGENTFSTHWSKFVATILESNDKSLIKNMFGGDASLSPTAAHESCLILIQNLVSLGPNGCGPNLLMLSPACSISITEDFVMTQETEVSLPPSHSFFLCILFFLYAFDKTYLYGAHRVSKRVKQRTDYPLPSL